MYLGPYQRPAQLHSATAQQSPQGSSMKGLCAVVGIGTTAVSSLGDERWELGTKHGTKVGELGRMGK